MKKLRMLCMAAALCLLPGVALAADAPLLIAPNPNAGAAQPAGVVVCSGYGTVEEVGGDYVVVKLEDGAPVQRAQLNITDESAVLDNATGRGVKLADIKKGDRVFACYSDRLTRSIPAQTPLIALFTNVDTSSPGVVWTVEDVAHSNSNAKKLTVDNGDLELTVYTDENIKTGDRIAAWYDAVMMSLPAQAVADRVVVLASVDTAVPTEVAEHAQTPVSAPMVVKVNGAEVKVVVERLHGEPTVPLRAIADALGYTLSWDGAKMAATISKGQLAATATMGSAALVINGDTVDLAAEVYLRNREKMFVPVQMFEKLGCTVKVGEQIEING